MDQIQENITQQIKILNYWHAIEFFVPFDLQEILDRKPYPIFRKQLIRQKDAAIPWLNQTAFQLAGGKPKKLYRYTIYLLPFDKNELTGLCNKLFPLGRNELEQIEFEERLDDEGKTCFARLGLNPYGESETDRFSISTLPWAIGKLQKNNLEELSLDNYQRDCEKLKTIIDLIEPHLIKTDCIIGDKKIPVKPLTASALLAIADILHKWANYEPRDELVAVVEMQALSEKERHNLLANQATQPSSETIEIPESKSQQPSPPLIKSAEKESTDKTSAKSKSVDEIPKDQEIDILNSFYIQDLEKVINYLSNHHVHPTLAAFLLGVEKTKKLNLYEKDNHAYILDKLSPQNTTSGRWPNENNYMMGLMQ